MNVQFVDSLCFTIHRDTWPVSLVPEIFSDLILDKTLNSLKVSGNTIYLKIQKVCDIRGEVTRPL